MSQADQIPVDSPFSRDSTGAEVLEGPLREGRPRDGRLHSGYGSAFSVHPGGSRCRCSGI